MPETSSYRCTVTLLLEDVTREVAEQFFQDNAEVEGCPPADGYIATVEAPGPIRRVEP